MDIYEDQFAPLFKWLGKQQKADLPRIQQAYNSLKANSDPRIVSQEGRVSAKQRRKLSYRILLEPNDNKWAKKTRLTEYFTRQRKMLETLLESVEEDVQRQKDVLEGLIDFKPS